MLAAVANPEGVDITPLLTKPSKIAIVCLGRSMPEFVYAMMTSASMKAPFDEVWTLNRGVRGVQHDKLFVMDDLRWLAKKDKAYGEYLQKHDRPIITSTCYPEFPNSVAYPLEEVYEKIGDDAFSVNTVAYMTALALYMGVQDVAIFGADFFYPNGNHAESGGQAVTFLIGLGRYFGTRFQITPGSTLLYANRVQPNGRRAPYGYHRKDAPLDAGPVPAANDNAAKKAAQQQPMLQRPSGW